MAGPTLATELEAGDTFDRHRRTWTVVEWWRGPYGCVVVLTDRGTVYLPQGAEVVVLDSAASQPTA